jgi:hypothetical protein
MAAQFAWYGLNLAGTILRVVQAPDFRAAEAQLQGVTGLVRVISQASYDVEVREQKRDRAARRKRDPWELD